MPQPPLTPPDVAVSTSRAPLGGMARGRKAFAIGRSSEWLWLGLLVAVIVALGAYGMMADLPYSRMGPEQKHVQLAVKYGSGDLNPHSFDHPPLFSYLLFGCYGVVYVVGVMTRQFHSPKDFERLYFMDPTLFYVIARLLILMVGVLSVMVFYATAKRLYGRQVARIASAFMGLAPVTIFWMHYATPTLLVLCLFLAACYFLVRILQPGGTRWDSCWAGLFAGLAVAAKYDAALIAVPLVVAHALAPQSVSARLRGAAAAMGMMAVGFVVGCPFALLNFRAFVADWHTLLYEELISSGAGRALLPVYLVNKPGWLYVLLDAWPAGWSMPLTVVGLGGLVYALIKRQRADLLLASLIAAAYLAIGGWQSIAPRHFITVMPFLLLLGARWLAAMAARLTPVAVWQSAMLGVATLGLLAVPVGRSIVFDRLVAQPSAHRQAAQWIEATVPSGAVIVAPTTLPLMPNAAAIHRRLMRIASRNLGQGVQLQRLLQYVNEMPRTYDVRELSWPWRANYEASDYDFRRQLAHGMRYVVLTQDEEYRQAPDAFAHQIAFAGDVKQHCALLKEFRSPWLWQESVAYTMQEDVQIYHCPS